MARARTLPTNGALGIPRRSGGVVAVLAGLHLSLGALGAMEGLGAGGRLAAGAAAAPSAAVGRLQGLVYERTLMSVANDRCGLFPAPLAKALEAATLQARGAALRAGLGQADLDAVEGRAAARAQATSCRNSDLQRAAQNVRDAFRGYADLRRLSFPGALGTWEADRRPPKDPVHPDAIPWRLVEVGRGPEAATAAGIAGGDDLLVVAAAPSGWMPASARLVMRDLRLAKQPYLDPRIQGLAGSVPPAWLTTVVLARDIRLAARGSPKGPSALLVIFSPAAADALSRLDPRESVRVDLVRETRVGEEVRSVYFEVGDFAAGRAFLAAGRRT